MNADNMNNQQPPQQPPQPGVVQVTVNGGTYPNEDGTWRVVVWFSGMKTMQEAHGTANWLQGLINANMKQMGAQPAAPPAPQPAPPAQSAPPRPEPSDPF